MNSVCEPPGFGTPMAQGVHRTARLVRLAGGLATLAGAVVALGGLAGIVFRIARPVRGGLAAVVVAALVGLVALVAGAAVAGASNRRTKMAATFELAATVYVKGRALAGGMSFVAGLLTIVVILANGVSAGLWLLDLLVACLNILGIALAMPRLRHLRRLHYTPSLPHVRA